MRERKEDLPFLVNRFLADANQELSKQVGGLSDSAWGLIQRYDWPGNARELRNQLRRAVLLCDDPEEMIAPELLGMLDGRGSPSECLGPDQAEQRCPLNGGSRACPLLTPCGALGVWGQPAAQGVGRNGMTAQVERAILLQALELTEGNKAHAARLLHIDYKTIHSKLKAYEISSTRFRGIHTKPLDAER